MPPPKPYYDETPDRYKICASCRLLRHRMHFTHEGMCLFCQVDRAREWVSRLEHSLNSLVPPGRTLQESCKHCHTPNWWLNLEEWKTFEGAVEMWCPSCRHDDHEKKYYLQMQEAPKIKDNELEDILKASGLLD